ncbi:pimeloyl-ACP methyl ester carboxylesterase [Bradyrhizobium sp. AZCC 2262]|uniref:hypothetical protein n=1 Tax=Bradyrhizobium sp. AZCC 2262 TaxID=3117022 RepID=UPI002FF3CBE2
MAFFFTRYVKTPTAITIFPGDYPISNPPLSAAKRGYNVVQYTAMPSGGHFAALEKPEELVSEIRAGLRSLGK